MSNSYQQSAEEYLESRLSELYGAEATGRIMQHVKEKSADLREDPTSPMQNTLNRLVYPFLTGFEALGIEGIPGEEITPTLLKIWEEMPEELKLSGLNNM